MVRFAFVQLVVAAFLAAGLSACAPSVQKPSEDQKPVAGADRRPSSFPVDAYRDAAARGEPVFSIDAARSRVVIEVRRAGALASAGHDHVIASHDVRGFIAPKSARADLYVILDRLTVDEPALRTEAGFDTSISEAAIAGTRANMLTRVLHSQTNPFVTVSVTRLDPEGVLDASITIDGITRAARVRVEIRASGDELRASGALALDQTDFGITPLSLFGGAIQVQNRVDIRFLIEAHRADSTLLH